MRNISSSVVAAICLCWATPAMAGALAGMEVGWRQSLEKLAELLETGSVTPRPASWD